MKTLAALSLFTLAPALLAPGRRAARKRCKPPPLEQEVALANPMPMPEPYQPPPDPYETAADPSQIDWPQDVTAEEAAVDSYDDGYDPQAYTQFQDELAPYGDWIDDGSYGRVWTPNASLVGTDFTPYYTGGHWVLTEFGWTWVSDWSWGWAPFHYGRWVIVSGFGWCWVPGTMWGPAWVTWRSGGGYVGWAALPPRGVSVTVDVRASIAVAVHARGRSRREAPPLPADARHEGNVPSHHQRRERPRADPRRGDRSHQRRPALHPERDAGAAEGRRAARVPAARDPSPPRREHVGAPVDPRGARGASAPAHTAAS